MLPEAERVAGSRGTLRVSEVHETELDRVAALQALDHELNSLRTKLAELTRGVRELEERRARTAQELQSLEAEYDGIRQRQRDLSAAIDEQSQRIRDSRMRMNRARTEREVLALKFEVNQAQERTRELEDELLGIYERAESAEKRIDELRKSMEEMDRQLAKERAESEEEAARLTAAIEEQRSRRDAVAASLDAGLRSRYERILERRGGVAVVEVRSGTCLGCHVQVPPQLYNDLLRYRDIRECPNCHRILYWRPEGQEEKN